MQTSLNMIAKLAGLGVVLMGLAACVDIDMEVDIKGEDAAKATVTMSMDASMYEMSKQGGGDNDFCDDGELIVDEKAAKCVTVKEGDFATVAPKDEGGEPQPTITNVGPGLVKVTFPTGTLGQALGGGNDADKESDEAQMMKAMFEGHAITLRVTGGEITESNMVIADDKQSASLSIAFSDMINGEAEVPEESYAIVKLK